MTASPDKIGGECLISNGKRAKKASTFRVGPFNKKRRVTRFENRAKRGISRLPQLHGAKYITERQ